MIRSLAQTFSYFKLTTTHNHFNNLTRPIMNGHTFKSRFYFSQNIHDEKIKNLLSGIMIDVKGEKKSMLNSGIITNHAYDEKASKVTIVLKIEKDFAKMRNVLTRLFRNQGYENVQVLLQQKQDKKIFQRKGNLVQVKRVIAVSSCKGGVGKSTIALNIAFGLSSQGLKVGLFDADVYGPSLPTLVNKQGQTLQASQSNPNYIKPKDVKGVKCMSFGFVASQPATMRGPMASSIVSKLLLNTEWGSLDYLIVDTPPGTGDINLSLCQQLKFDGAVIATTPQRLSFIDVIKGVKMFQDLRVRILAIVENMSYYSCSKCQTTEQIFGKGHNKLVTQQLGIDNSFKIPLMSELSKCSDTGNPAVITLPENHKVRKTYLQICTAIKKQLQLPRNRAGVYYNTGDRVVIVEQGKKQKKIDPVLLRSECKCLECIHQITGQLLLDKKSIDPEVYPVRIQQKGNYAVGVVWSDGHKNSIYSFKRLFSQQIPQK